MKGMHGHLLHNGEIRDTSQPLVSPGQVGYLNGWGVFSTLWVSEGVLFAYERHFARMARDAARMRVPFFDDPNKLKNQLLRLVQANNAQESTLRVAVVRNRGGLFEGTGITREYDTVAFTADRKNWGDAARLGIVPQGRHAANEFAGAKVTSWSQNLTWYDRAHEQGFDEVVLLNERGEVSECTSANLFAVMGKQVWTPPLHSGCLPGITRELLLEQIKVEGITIGERELLPSDLEQADSVFMTSSTRDLMPVAEIDTLSIRREDDVRAQLQTAFQEYRKQYVAEAKEAAAAGVPAA